MEKVLITGGAGFIGGYLTKELVSEYEVVILDHFNEQIHGSDYTASYLYHQVKDIAQVVKGSVLDKALLAELLQGVDYIFHLAAETGTGQSMYELSRYAEVNILGLANLLEIITTNKLPVKKIVLSSSRSVYGEGMYHCPEHDIVIPASRETEDLLKKDFSVKCPFCKRQVELLKTTEFAQPKPISFYAYTKWAQEKMLEQMCPTLGMDYTIFRYQNVYGIGQSLNNPYTGILSIFSKQLLNQLPLNIFEDGQESRDFVHVADVAWYTAQSIKQAASHGEIINVGSGEKTSVLEVANTLKDIYRSTSPIRVSGDFRKGDIKHNIADMTKADRIFGWRDKIPFQQGIQSFAHWVKQEIVPAMATNLDYEKSIEELKNSGMFVQGS